MSPARRCIGCREASDFAQFARLADPTYQRGPEEVLSMSVAFIT